MLGPMSFPRKLKLTKQTLNSSEATMVHSFWGRTHSSRTVGITCNHILFAILLVVSTCHSCTYAGDSYSQELTTVNLRQPPSNRTIQQQGHATSKFSSSENKSERRPVSTTRASILNLQYGGRGVSKSQRRQTDDSDFLFGAIMSRPAVAPTSLLPFTSSKLGGEPRDKMLKSSKDALIVTKKSYLKKDWCKTEPLIQRIREVGCVTRTMVNRFCYGQCNSFYIPKNAKVDMESTAFKSCSFCKPKRFRWITITLRCPGRNPPYKKKRIQRIKKCKCMSEILQ